MSETFRVAIIGAGRRGERRGGAYGIAEAHAAAYEACPATVIVAAADINEENLRPFLAEHQIPRGYRDYREMLARERPDIVSICTWPQLHAEMVIAAAQAGARGILCEKPMALTLAEADAMLAACAASGTVLCVNHQRRLGEPFRLAKEIASSGAIGDLVRVEGYVGGSNLYDWGTHWLDMFAFLLDERPAQWVMAQVDLHPATTNWGLRVEAHAIVHLQYADDIRGYLEVGVPIKGQPALRLIGTEGLVELYGPNTGRPTLRARLPGEAGWTVPPTSETIHERRNFQRAVEDLVQALQTGREPALSGRRARATTEIIVAAYESAYRRGKVVLPCAISDLPLARLAAAIEG